jgi:hypothetical protein
VHSACDKTTEDRRLGSDGIDMKDLGIVATSELYDVILAKRHSPKIDAHSDWKVFEVAHIPPRWLGSVDTVGVFDAPHFSKPMYVLVRAQECT